MDKLLLKKAAKQSVALMIGVVTLSYALNHYRLVTIEASKQTIVDETKVMSRLEYGQKVIMDNKSVDTKAAFSVTEGFHLQDYPITKVEDLKKNISDSILQQLNTDYIVIKKPKGNQLEFSLKDLYMNRTIEVNIDGMADEDLGVDSILRIRGDDLFTGNPVYTEVTTMEVDQDTGLSEEVITKDFGKDISHRITITTNENKDSKTFSTKVLIELDTIYAYNIYKDDNYYFIDLRKPSEVYDKIVVIDPGHGGKDVGAISKNGRFYEKDINLDIALQLKKILENENIKVYYTRTEDSTVFLRPRVTLANEVDSDYFISIHCNSNTLSSPSGSEVLYYNTEFKGVKSADLAAVFAEELGKLIPLKKRGTIKKHPEDIFIMDKALVPMVLIEVGYMSNFNDMNYLSDSKNRKIIAQGIYNGIMRAYEELPVTK